MPYGTYPSGLTFKHTDLPICPRFTLRKAIPSAFPHTFLRHSISQSVHSGTGILTCFHSPSQLCLCLGPDSPRADKPSPGNLGLPAGGILALLLATHSCILTSDTSSIPFRTPSTAYRTLSYQTCLARFRGFGSCLSPVISSAQILSTSELLRTLSRYGCF